MTLILDGTSGVTVPQGAVYNGLATGNAQGSTSGTSIDFTGIPVWVKRVTVMFSGVSTSGTSNLLIQLGSGTFQTSGYASLAGAVNNTQTGSTSGFIITAVNAATTNQSGNVILNQLGSNIWLSGSTVGPNASGAVGGNNISTGNVTLSGVLDRVRITTVNGTDTFDNGTINIMYE